IVGDASVSMEFGTGAVKVTPAHDPNDFETGLRHNLPIINILNNDVTINENGGKFASMDRFAARKAIVAELESSGLLERVEPHTHAVGHCQRCRTIIEPIASRQWFIKIAPLAEPAITAVKDGSITVMPERFSKVYLNWMENIRDWCISRQLWWGHRIPVWYCACGETIVTLDEPNACPKCGSEQIVQDPDVLDTWFSSGLWTHSTLGWPDSTPDLQYFYPTTVMETAYDILFFWVARMIMMGIENMNQPPFRYVYLHGLIRDENGEKMSKTKGNSIDPLDVMQKYGTDALRFAIISGIAPGNDSKLSSTKLEAGRNFANKLWNAARFVLRYSDTGLVNTDINTSKLTLEDRWIVSRLNTVAAEAGDLMQKFEFGEALRAVHDFLWGEYCDWYIELSKARLSDESALSPIPVLVHVLEISLRLLHPYMPFVTEELWQHINKAFNLNLGDSIMVVAYPSAEKTEPDMAAESTINTLIEIVRAVRNTRAEYEVEPNRLICASVYVGERTAMLKPYIGALEILARAKVTVDAERRGTVPPQALGLVLQNSEIVIPMESMFDLRVEMERITKEITEITAEICRLEALLGDKAFCAKAPVAIVEKQREKLTAACEKLERLMKHKENLTG
ncbi:MAG: valine--tRNA ligase, partial [Dehalococcoidia bacterium]|nr:valine--tRNA ligase [Dehalococcoidia bacterium]